MTKEQFVQAQRVFEISKQAVDEELWNTDFLAAVKGDHQRFGETEFQVRDIVHRIATKTLENAVSERRKKGMLGSARRAASVTVTRISSIGDRKPS